MALTVGELIAALKDEDPATPVILQKDAEGNGYSPLEGVDPCMYLAETTWSGDTYDLPSRDAEPGEEGPPPEGSVRAVVLYPVN